jgi:hypothetical protein
VGAVALTVLGGLAVHEGPGLDVAPGEVRVIEVEAGVEDRDDDASAGLGGVGDAGGLQSPGQLVGVAELRGPHRGTIRL